MRRDSGENARLKRFHETVGRAREARSPEALAEIAIHYDQAGLKPQAYASALKGAKQATTAFAYDEANELLSIAERNAADPAEVAEVRLQLALIAEVAGRYETGLQLCEQADEWFSKKGPAERRIMVRRLRERLRDLLGQPAADSLRACESLLAEAEKERCNSESIALRLIISQARARLGDLEGARATAEEAVREAESLAEQKLLAQSLNRLGLTQRPTDPERAVASWRRALQIFGDIGDERGSAGCHNNLGIYHSDRGEWQAADRELNEAASRARRAGARADLGAATLNLGVAVLKRGEFDDAHRHLGESLALFAMIRNSERQLYALYNLAHLERERGQHELAGDLYDFAAELAKRIGQSDVEIGATAGSGLARLNRGQLDAASELNRAADSLLAARREWFQGRELAEALRIRLLARKGDGKAAIGQFDTALSLAESSDFYCAAWLTAECARDLLGHDSDRIRSSVSRLASRAQEFGLHEITRRYQQVLRG